MALNGAKALVTSGKINGYGQVNSTLFQTVQSPTPSPTWNLFHPYFKDSIERFAPTIIKITGDKKVKVVTGFRTIQYNEYLKGIGFITSDNSPHLGGIAMDVFAAKPDVRLRIANEAYAFGFGGIAIGPNFVHIDIGPSSTWKYSNSDTHFISVGGA